KTDYKFNVTHLNSYLNCPLCFYFKTILRIPASKDKFASLGTAVHASLSFLFNYLKNQNKLLSKDELLEVYRRNLLRENLSQKNFDEVLYQGAKHLSDYYDHYQSEFNCECLIDYDFKPDNVFMDGIPLTGKVDKIDILPSINNGLSNVNVIDFKTGNPDTKAQEMKLGADYFRQLVFYKILADNDPNFKYHVTSGSIDFVQKSKRSDKFVKKDYPLTDKDVAEVKVLIREVYQKILNLEFDPSPDCEDRDGLHELIK
ncbi:MAG TPA: PD-(D/E)XK nuclease family protein, partial [Patescibacteria group bacterium]